MYLKLDYVYLVRRHLVSDSKNVRAVLFTLLLCDSVKCAICLALNLGYYKCIESNNSCLPNSASPYQVQFITSSHESFTDYEK